MTTPEELRSISSFRIDVPGSYRMTIRRILEDRHRYASGSRYRTRLGNMTRRLIRKLRAYLAEHR